MKHVDASGEWGGVKKKKKKKEKKKKEKKKMNKNSSPRFLFHICVQDCC
jgi:hypothetical protein